MSIPAWPSGSVTNSPLADSYNEEPEDWNVDSFQPEQGPPIQGINSTASTDAISYNINITPTEWGALNTFWRVTVSSGVLKFSWNNPATGNAETVQFLVAPKV